MREIIYDEKPETNRRTYNMMDAILDQCGEMLNHLEELGQRFYAGDIKVVDEFLQLYALDKYRKDYNRD